MADIQFWSLYFYGLVAQAMTAVVILYLTLIIVGVVLSLSKAKYGLKKGISDVFERHMTVFNISFFLIALVGVATTPAAQNTLLQLRPDLKPDIYFWSSNENAYAWLTYTLAFSVITLCFAKRDLSVPPTSILEDTPFETSDSDIKYVDSNVRNNYTHLNVYALGYKDEQTD